MIKETFIQEKRSHESAAKHVSGSAYYTDDIFEPEGTLYGAIGWAKKSHAIIRKINLDQVIRRIKLGGSEVEVINLNDESLNLFSRIGQAKEAGGRGGEFKSAH